MFEIDLHGYKHTGARRTLELFINEHWGSRFKVITGHSQSMRNVVYSLVKEYDLDCITDCLGSYIILDSG